MSKTEESTGKAGGSEQDVLDLIRDQEEEDPQKTLEDSAQDVLGMIRNPEEQIQLFEKLGKQPVPHGTSTAAANNSVGHTLDPNEAHTLMELKDQQVVRNGNPATSAQQGEMLLKDQAIRTSFRGSNTQKPHASPGGAGEERSQVTESSSVNPRPRHPSQYSTYQNQPPVDPGAYAIGGIGGDRSSNHNPANNTSNNPVPEAPPPVADIEDGLPVANQVNDNSNLPVADMATQNQDRKNPTSSSTISTVAAILFFVACLVGVVIVIFSVAGTEASKTTSESVLQPATAPPSSDPPTDNPTSSELLLLQLFPNYTLEAIQEGRNSSQSLAYQWMLWDLEANNYTNVNTNTMPMLTSRIKQRFALASLYFATTGEEWLVGQNWLNHSIHECFWFSQEEFLDFDDENFTYIEVMNSNPCEIPNEEFNTTSQAVHVDYGDYQHLWLHSNFLEGTIPLELYWLTSLRSISMYNNEALTGSLSSFIGKLTKLEAINMGGSALTGTLPTELGLLSESFFSIAIHYAQLEGTLPSELGLLTHMHSLLIDQNQFSGTLPAELGNASNLKWIYLEGSFISGTIPNWFPNLALERIYLEGNQLTGTIPTEIGLLESMEQFVVYSNLFSSDTIPTQVGQMSNIQKLDFDDCYLTGGLPTELGLPTKMEQFWAEWNSLTGKIPSEFGQWSNLEYLMLGGNSFTGMIPSELGKLALNELSLEENSLSGSLPDGLSPLLEFLDVTNNSMLTGTFPLMESLPHNAWVFLSGTQISGTLPESLCEIEILEFDCGPMLCGCDCLCLNGTANDGLLNLTTGILYMQEVGNETRNITGIRT